MEHLDLEGIHIRVNHRRILSTAADDYDRVLAWANTRRLFGG